MRHLILLSLFMFVKATIVIGVVLMSGCAITYIHYADCERDSTGQCVQCKK